jgi:hypothetical protein
MKINNCLDYRCKWEINIENENQRIVIEIIELTGSIYEKAR